MVSRYVKINFIRVKIGTHEIQNGGSNMADYNVTICLIGITNLYSKFCNSKWRIKI